MEDRAMFLFFTGLVAALAPSAIAFGLMIWAGGIEDDPDQLTARILPFIKAHPKQSA
jgi:hypothetical protein